MLEIQPATCSAIVSESVMRTGTGIGRSAPHLLFASKVTNDCYIRWYAYYHTNTAMRWQYLPGDLGN